MSKTSNTDRKLQKLADLGTAFLQAAFGGAYDRMTGQVTARFNTEEARLAEGLAAKDEGLRTLFAAMKSGGVPQKELDNIRHEGMKNFIRRVDVFAAVAVRNLGMEAASRHVDADNRTEKNSKAFVKIEAPVLARLFAPEAP